MTTFRCPYCKKALPESLPRRCPHCDKVLIRANPQRKQDFRLRKKARLEIQRAADRKRRTVTPPRVSFGTPANLFAILVVLLVLGSLIVGRLRRREVSQPRRSQDYVAIEELESLRMALELFRKDCRRYPTTGEGLKALVLDPGENRWFGSYLTLLKPDPWKNAYRYGLSNDVVTLYSLGADGTAGTADDLYASPPDSNDVYRIWVEWHTYR